MHIWSLKRYLNWPKCSLATCSRPSRAHLFIHLFIRCLLRPPSHSEAPGSRSPSFSHGAQRLVWGESILRKSQCTAPSTESSLTQGFEWMTTQKLLVQLYLRCNIDINTELGEEKIPLLPGGWEGTRRDGICNGSWRINREAEEKAGDAHSSCRGQPGQGVKDKRGWHGWGLLRSSFTVYALMPRIKESWDTQPEGEARAGF